MGGTAQSAEESGGVVGIFKGQKKEKLKLKEGRENYVEELFFERKYWGSSRGGLVYGIDCGKRRTKVWGPKGGKEAKAISVRVLVSGGGNIG